jgi:hypothetical protein
MSYGDPCTVRDSLLVDLFRVSKDHAREAALLTAIAAAGDHAGFAVQMERCAETQGNYEIARDALKAHRREHGC